MKGAWVEAERVEEVRAAARGWKRAGAIGTGTFEEILRRYPEPRTLPAPLWRVVTFLLVSAILLLLGGALVAGLSPAIKNAPFWCASLGVAFVVVAELQARSRSLARRGGVEAASFWGIVALVGGIFIFFEESLHAGNDVMVNAGLLGAALLFGLAAQHWGNPAFAGFAAGAVFILLARAPQGRLLWVAAGVALSAAAERFLDRPSWAPSHRACAAVLVAVGLVGVYAAVNLYALDHRLVEKLGSARLDASGPSFGERIASMVLTALVPLAAVVWGIRSRRAFALDVGLVLTALSLLTLRFYVHLAATWLVLTLAGAALLLLALGVNRWLAKGAAKERSGFTAESLFADERRLRALELVPVVAAHAPESRPPVEPGYQGGGGSFGGGGAGGSF
jgi:uncharacterized membrane protein YgcG